MNRYYYLVASLPTLQFGVPAPMGYEAFKALCAKHLSKGDLAAIRSADLSVFLEAKRKGSASALFESFRTWELGLREELVSLRAKKLGKAAAPWLRGHAIDKRAAAAAVQAMQAPDPLTGEIALESARWAFIDGEKLFHYFDMEILIAYAFQLQILERIALFQAEAGTAKYRELYAAVLGAVKKQSHPGVSQ